MYVVPDTTSHFATASGDEGPIRCPPQVAVEVSDIIPPQNHRGFRLANESIFGGQMIVLAKNTRFSSFTPHLTP